MMAQTAGSYPRQPPIHNSTRTSANVAATAAGLTAGNQGPNQATPSSNTPSHSRFRFKERANWLQVLGVVIAIIALLTGTILGALSFDNSARGNALATHSMAEWGALNDYMAHEYCQGLKV